MTLVSARDTRLVADIERLIKKKIELEPADPAWESKAPAAPRGVSPNIKPKKRVAALFGEKQLESAES